MYMGYGRQELCLNIKTKGAASRLLRSRTAAGFFHDARAEILTVSGCEYLGWVI